MSDLEKGAKVVHKAHGVGTICGVEKLVIGGVSQEFYLMKIDSSELIIKFPKSNLRNVVREVIAEKDVAEVFKIVGGQPIRHRMVWNRRKKEYLDKIKSGDIFSIAEVLRDLGRPTTDERELSLGEKEMLEEARERVVHEISVARAQNYQEVETAVSEALQA